MIVGRKEELKRLKEAYNSEYSEFVAVYGRRRVGKTFLIREMFDYQFTFQHTGLAKSNMHKQLSAWKSSIRDAGMKVPASPTNWLDAFEMLKDLVRQSSANKKVIFIDEMPWMDTPRSGFVSALESFWNGWASGRKDILLIICGSATSWIINKVIKNHGGLHNRVTCKIPLRPFTLKECEKLTENMKLGWGRKQVLETYMIMGGIPFYWTMLNRELSVAQNIDRIFFGSNALLADEFGELYASLFREPEMYLSIIRTLGKKRVGMTRDELIKEGKLAGGGDVTKVLEDLEYCGFIRKYNLIGRKTKGAIFQLVDFFTLFYFKMLEGHELLSQFWSSNVGSRQYEVWCGLAFERICLWHVEQIKRALSIGGVQSQEGTWYSPRNVENVERGAQIDLLIDRKDDTINVCEMKYYNTEVVLTADEENKIQNRINRLREESGTSKAIHAILVTTKGLKRNNHSDIIHSVVTMDDLFA